MEIEETSRARENAPTIWDQLAELQNEELENEDEAIGEFVNDDDNFEALKESLAEMYQDKDPRYGVLKETLLEYASPANLMFNYNSLHNERNDRVNLRDTGITPMDLMKAVPDYYFPIYVDAMKSVAWTDEEIRERLGFDPLNFNVDDWYVEDDEDYYEDGYDDYDDYEDSDEDFEDGEEELFGERERFKKRVHDDFGPEDARMIAYAKRISDWSDDEGRHWNNNTFNTYSAVTDVLPKIFDPEDYEGPTGWDKWVTDNYRLELQIIRNIYSQSALSWTNRGEISKANGNRNIVNKIDKVLLDPSAEPDWGTKSSRRFPATMEYQEGGIFLHCRDVNSAIFGDEETELRLYMHPKPDKMIDLVAAFKKKCDDQDQRYYFKISRQPRADGFIIYTNYEQVDKKLDILSQIQKERPDLFEGMDDGYKNPFWGEIDGAPKGVYFGEEPARYPRAFEPTAADLGMDNDDYGYSSKDVPYFMGYSYSGLRSDVFDIAFEKWMKEVYHEEKTKDLSGLNRVYLIDGVQTTKPISFKSPEDISWSAAKRLEELFRGELAKADIDPENMCFDKYPDRH